MPAASIDTTPSTPQTVNNCPQCSHWLPDGTLACPDCGALAYGQHLGQVAYSAQQLEQAGQWVEARERWVSALEWLPPETTQADGVRQHIAAIDGKLAAEDAQKARWKKRLGPFAPVALFLLKIKSAFFILLKLKFLLGMLSFFVVYWVLFGWKFALGFMLCLLIHEMGHYVAVKRRGLKADLPMFLPGLGAYVRWYSMGVSRADMAAISLAGPLFGLFAALGCYGLWWGYHWRLMLVLANVGAWINLFNLVPVLGLDGSQATYALASIQRGLIAALCLVFFGLTVSLSGGEFLSPTTQWVFAFVAVGMLYRCFTRDTPEAPDTRTMVYFLALVLALGFVLLATVAPIAALSQGVQQPVAGVWF